MAQEYNQNPLEQFEPEKIPVGWPWRLLSIVSAIFLFAVLVYAGLAFGYGPYLASQLREVENEIDQLAASVPREDQEQFVKFYSQLVNLEGLLNDHALVSNLFPLLEQTTHQQVYYTNASLGVSGSELELTGFAGDLTALSEQLEIFDQSEEVNRYSLSRSETSGDLVEFRVVLNLRADLLK